MEKIIQRILNNEAGVNKAVLLGDIMIDEYVFGTINRISPEAPIPVVNKESVEYCLGGASNVAVGCHNIGLQTTLIGVVNDQDSTGRRALAMLQGYGLSAHGVVLSPHRRTTIKRRIVSASQQCLRIDEEDKYPLSEKEYENVIYRFEKFYQPKSIVIISDYANGVIDKKLVSHVVSKARANGDVVIVDPKGPHFGKYYSVDYIKPNLLEFNQMVSFFNLSPHDGMKINARKICSILNIKGLIVTMGDKGIRFISYEEDMMAPAYKQEVYDLSGAGDTVLAFLALGLIKGLSFEDMLRLANKAASLAVAHYKTHPVGIDELLTSCCNELGKTIDDWQVLQKIVTKLSSHGKKIVFTNGCFDIIHAGHVHILQQAKRQGDILIVALNSDSSVKRLGKGPERPVNTLEDRMRVVAGLGCVDFVTSFDQDTPLEIIELLQPDVIVKGGDYKAKEVVGYDVVTKKGGSVVIVDLLPGRSTTKTLGRARVTSGVKQPTL